MWVKGGARIMVTHGKSCTMLSDPETKDLIVSFDCDHNDSRCQSVAL